MTTNEVQQISTFRRVFPQVLATLAKNLIIFNLGEFIAFPSIVLPSLAGLNAELNPDETVHATGAEISWLSSFAHIAHPVGSLISAPISDKFGRRKAIMLVSIPIVAAWIMLGFAHSFSVICFGFILIGFGMGSVEAPATLYVGEISQASLRGTITSITMMSYNVGILIVFCLGSILSWHHVSLICAYFPICCLIAVFFIPETPFWLISRGRSDEAQRSLQWLRGWVSPQTVHTEFNELQDFSRRSNACGDCSRRSIKCNHPMPTFWNKISELKRKRNLKPFILCVSLYFFQQFALYSVWQAYIVQILIALGTPIDASLVTVLNALIGMAGSIILMLTIKTFGRRRIYLTASMIVVLCSVGLGIYGFTFLPSGWSSFKKYPTEDYEGIKEEIGQFSYLAVALVFLMQFNMRFAVGALPSIFVTEVFPFRSRSYLCGIATALNYTFAAIGTKTYYIVETAISLPGACLVYAAISIIGFCVMLFIMPETEQRSLEEIELHYSDNAKGLTDIHICQQSNCVQRTS